MELVKLWYKYLNRMTDLELLKFITEYLSVPIPLKIDEKKVFRISKCWY